MPDSSSLIGQIISHYRIVEKLGAGGMGEVYRAHDEDLKRDVALKILPPDSQGSVEAQKELLREARSASALNDPHICIIHEVGEAAAQRLPRRREAAEAERSRSRSELKDNAESRKSLL